MPHLFLPLTSGMDDGPLDLASEHDIGCQPPHEDGLRQGDGDDEVNAALGATGVAVIGFMG